MRSAPDASWSAPVTDLFGVGGRSWLGRLELAPDERLALDAQLRLLDALEVEITAAERAIAAQVVDDPRVRHLLTVPGIGLATAASLVAVIGDVGRVPRPHKLVSYFGLDPEGASVGRAPGLHLSTSAGPARPTPAAYLSRRPTPRSRRRARCAGSSCGPAVGAAPGWRSWRLPASSSCSPGTC
ncbi:MAG: transposase [Candidatus Limnocylindrales bacterium]